MTFDALSNAAYCVSLHEPEAELEGGVQTLLPTGWARSAPSSGPARVNLCPGGEGELVRAPAVFSSLSGNGDTKFCLPHHCSFLHHVQNFEVCVGSGQVISTGQVNSPPKKPSAVSRPQFVSE